MRQQKSTSLIVLLLVVTAAAALAGCVRQVAPASTPTLASTSQLEEVLNATKSAATATSEMPTATPTKTPESEAPTETPGPTNTLEVITPTNTAAPTQETSENPDTSQPTETAAPQPTSSAPQINPDQEFTGARYVDELDEIEMWTDRSGALPDTQYIALKIEDGVMTVTGKRSLWDTWWISGFTLSNFYVEMDVNSGDCDPDDAYGMILRASQHNEPTRGYLVGFTCAGEVFARRLESVDPYVSISILNPTETDLINAGKNQDNIFGVLLDDNTITIYPNRRYFTTITDNAFAWGRYGIYISTGETGDYTFTVREIRTWGSN